MYSASSANTYSVKFGYRFINTYSVTSGLVLLLKLKYTVLVLLLKLKYTVLVLLLKLKYTP
jgi:hypothetical protein